MIESCITQYGAKPDGLLMTAPIQQAINETAAKGGGKVIVPAGVFVTGGLYLKSNINLHLEAGATLKFSDDPVDYPLVASRWEGVEQLVHASCIFAEDAQHIAITGSGCLDGNGHRWWEVFCKRPASLPYPRPTLVCFKHCQQIVLKDFRAINSPSWTIHPLLSSDITIENLTIHNPADSPNTDGINPESCSNVRISHCTIDVGDDCIAVKSGTEANQALVPCENITITDCQMLHGHGGIVLGSEMSGGIRRLTASHCTFTGTDRGIRIKSRLGRGGIIEDIYFNNIAMQQVICPFVMNLHYPFSLAPKLSEKTAAAPSLRGIHFEDISVTQATAAAGFFYGLAEAPIRDINFTNIIIEMAENPELAQPAMIPDLEAMAQQGFILRFIENCRFEHVVIRNHLGKAYQLENCQNIEILK